MKVGMIFGEGVSGRGAREILKKMKYEIIMVDDKTGMPSDSAEELMDKVDIFIKSPGIPYTHLVKKAFEMKVEVVDEIELAYRYMKKVGIKTKISSYRKQRKNNSDKQDNRTSAESGIQM